MTFFDDIKILIFFRNLLRRVEMLNRMKGIMGHLDGVKSVLGLLMVTAYYALPVYAGVHVPDVVLKLGMGMASVGLVHKLEKGTGVVSGALDVLKKALASLDSPAK